jgi:hypothetical protein
MPQLSPASRRRPERFEQDSDAQATFLIGDDRPECGLLFSVLDQSINRPAPPARIRNGALLPIRNALKTPFLTHFLGK